MESIEINLEKYAVVLNINLNKATLIEAKEFKDYFEDAVTKTDKDIIVNLSVCEYLDSTFLGILVRTHKKLLAQNRTIAIIEPVNQSSILLTLNSIGKIFPIYSSVKIALDDIENKRLLETEFQETPELGESDSDTELISSGVGLQTMSDETENQNEELETNEFESTPEIVNTDLEIVEEPMVMQDEMKERSWNLISNNKENEFTTTQEFASENELEAVSSVSVKAEQNYDTTDYEESEYEGNIKWEFGFSS